MRTGENCQHFLYSRSTSCISTNSGARICCDTVYSCARGGPLDFELRLSKKYNSFWSSISLKRKQISYPESMLLSGASGLSHLLHSRLATRGRSGRCTCGASVKDDKPSEDSKQRTKLPERGFFAEADTKGAPPLHERGASRFIKQIQLVLRTHHFYLTFLAIDFDWSPSASTSVWKQAAES